MPAKPKPTASTTAIIDRPDPCPPEFVQAAIDALPAEITKVIVVDYGVKHPAPDLITQIEEMLETHSICQPFSRITYLDKDQNELGCMSSAAQGHVLGDRRRRNPQHYCQQGIVALVRHPGEITAWGMIPGYITSPVPTPYVPPVIEPVEYVQPEPVYAYQEPSDVYTDPIRILPEDLANLDTQPNP